MKYPVFVVLTQVIRVAPFTGAWIEILLLSLAFFQVKVAPFTGAWIEMK